MRPSEQLRRARTLIAEPGAWIQGASAKSLSGRVVDPRSAAAVCFCPEAAVRACEDEAVGSYWALHYLRQETSSDIASWNDNPRRTQAEALDAFDRAIAAAQADGR